MQGKGEGPNARRLIAIVTAALGIWVAAGGAAWAGEADDLVKQGLELRRKGQDAQAIDLFRRAHELDKGARVTAQLGFVEQALGMWTDAEAHLVAALDHRDDPWIKKNQAAIRTARDFVASHLGSLEVWALPSGAELVIGRTLVGTLPLSSPLRVTAGTVSVTVRAAGYVEQARVVEVRAGGVARERFELARKAARPVTLAPTADVAAAGGGDRPPVAQLRAQPVESSAEPSPSPSILSRWWFWTLVGAVAIGGAATAYVLTRPTNDCPIGQCGGVAH